MSGLGIRQGLGNRLQALVTGFALALLTDRVLFVDDPYGRYFGIFKPTFDCNYTQTRRDANLMTAPADCCKLCGAHGPSQLKDSVIVVL